MNRFRNFLRTSLFGGLVVILPVAISIIIFKWLFDFITDIIQPLTNLIRATYTLPEFFAHLLVLLIILATCFMVGIIVKTKIGNFVHRNLENRILRIAPGYTMIKETVMQFFERKKSPFSSVVMVRLDDRQGLSTAFLTEQHDNGLSTVFIPFGLNMTAGQIFHVKSERVYPLDIPVEKAIRSILSCGAGSAPLLSAFEKKYGPVESIITAPLLDTSEQ